MDYIATAIIDGELIQEVAICIGNANGDYENIRLTEEQKEYAKKLLFDIVPLIMDKACDIIDRSFDGTDLEQGQQTQT